METTNCWLQIEGWIFCLRCSLSGDMWTCWDFLWCLYFTSHLSALILYSKSDSPNIDTLTRVYYIHLVKWTKFFRKPVINFQNMLKFHVFHCSISSSEAWWKTSVQKIIEQTLPLVFVKLFMYLTYYQFSLH